jgi:23S rRNA pseudouridine1911/1915/1917 synthase
VLECRLETGRTHQIRVHMAHIRHPLIGDPLYGGAFRLPKAASENLVETLRAFKRQALHAEKLSFTHPVTQQPMAFESPLPADMVALIGSLRDDTRQFNAA